jgi:hypothetical protein
MPRRSKPQEATLGFLQRDLAEDRHAPERDKLGNSWQPWHLAAPQALREPPCQNIYRKTKTTEERLNDNWVEAKETNRRGIENIESKEDCEVWQEEERAIGPVNLSLAHQKIWRRQADS